MNCRKNPAQQLKELMAEKDFCIGIDSDGCVFDSMGLKHKECFAPMFIKHFGLQSVSQAARDVWEFVNLYSKTRGVNRFLAVVRALKLLKQHPDVIVRNVAIPDTGALEEWISRETKLGNPALEKEVENGNEVLASALAWSLDVNRAVEEIVCGVPPLPFVKECLGKMVEIADVLVVSQTPLEALEREWKENDMDGFVRGIAGQEHGTKSEHLELAAAGKYPPGKILMVGDAPGDFDAAKNNKALFFPIVPGREAESWECLLREGLDRFFAGTFEGEYEEGLVRQFETSLPELPPWEVQTDVLK
ncbi:MAG: HAD family hydrolase [Verrucomicrobiota bacterium]|nr:HAD family hydrolase [Verrucomicrobiota bacterium]